MEGDTILQTFVTVGCFQTQGVLKDANSIVEPPFPLCGQSLGPLVSQMVATSTCKQLNRCQVPRYDG